MESQFWPVKSHFFCLHVDVGVKPCDIHFAFGGKIWFKLMFLIDLTSLSQVQHIRQGKREGMVDLVDAVGSSSFRGDYWV
jgi:hypothetical protein